MPEKLKGICRLCLSKDGLMFPIFGNDGKSETPFRSKILSCASIEIFADDELPSEICHICAHQVEKSYRFKTICENSDAALRSRLNASSDDFSGENANAPKSENARVDDDDALCFPSSKLSEENTVGVFICFACSLSLTSCDKLLDHLAKMHPDASSFPCEPCKMHFYDLNDYRNHVNLKHALNCDKCDRVFKNRKNFESHLRSHSTIDVYSCQYCKKLFDERFKLKKHELEHLENMCTFCCKIFDAKEDYREHAKNCNRSHSCKFCDNAFGSKKDLIEHVNGHHESSSVHKCNACDKLFGKWSDLENHDCKGESGVRCKYCRKTFGELSALESHVAMEHGEEHLVCKFCTKSFALKSALRRHEKSHSGVKPYQCKYCPRKFKDNSTCTVHTRTHTGEHPFRCQECHKDFKQLANLKMHIYRHHKTNSQATEEARQTETIYGQAYGQAPVADEYSSDAGKNFQQIDLSISSPGFSESTNV